MLLTRDASYSTVPTDHLTLVQLANSNAAFPLSTSFLSHGKLKVNVALLQKEAQEVKWRVLESESKAKKIASEITMPKKIRPRALNAGQLNSETRADARFIQESSIAGEKDFRLTKTFATLLVSKSIFIG